MEITNANPVSTRRISNGLKHALVDLEYFAHELAEGCAGQEKEIKRTQHRTVSARPGDPLVPMIKGIMYALIAVAAGLFFYIVKGLA